MASGVGVNATCIKEFNDMKIRQKYTYIIFKIVDKTEVQIETLDKGSYDDFKNNLPKNECRFAAVDVPITTVSGIEKGKIVFILWAPEVAGVRDRLLYATTKDALSRKLEGVQKIVQANDEGDLDQRNISA